MKKSRLTKWYAIFIVVFVAWQGLVVVGVKSMNIRHKQQLAGKTAKQTKNTAPAVIYVATPSALGD